MCANWKVNEQTSAQHQCEAVLPCELQRHEIHLMGRVLLPECFLPARIRQNCTTVAFSAERNGIYFIFKTCQRRQPISGMYFESLPSHLQRTLYGKFGIYTGFRLSHFSMTCYTLRKPLVFPHGTDIILATSKRIYVLSPGTTGAKIKRTKEEETKFYVARWIRYAAR